MKLLISLLLAALLACGAVAETADVTPEPQDAAVADESALQIDFSTLTVDDPLSTPVPVDPIDKPTPEPAPTPSYWYDTYVSDDMGVSFKIPDTWLLNPNYPQATVLQFVEPQSEMMDEGGYQARVTIEKVDRGLNQSGDDARAHLEQVLTELAQTFTSFTPNNIASQTFGKDDLRGSYCYYRAEYNDGTKTYSMRGRIAVFADGRSLYQVRVTAPSNWYSYYEWVYRTIRSSFDVL